MKRILLWHRHDLRLHDRADLQEAIASQAQIIPVYCFDPRQFGKTAFGFPKTGSYRARFLRESVADLRNSLRQRGSDLVVRCGKPENILPQLARDFNIDGVFFQEEVTSEETTIDRAVSHRLNSMGVTVKTFWSSTLFHPDNLPVSISDLPEIFTQFRKQVEKNSPIDATFTTPTQLPQLPGIEVGEIPTLEALGVEPPQFDDRAVLKFKGGETAGMARLKAYFWEFDRLRSYKQTRNGMLGANYSSKFSPWLALGCLSPRYIYEQVKAYESQRVRNDSTYWLVFELLWRDYFRFICTKHGDRVFYRGGLRGLDIDWKQDWERFELWAQGKTGYPLVDANMRELRLTGFMSNRGRQNVASFLTKNLGIDWRMGAEWFESLLIDYDVCSNWGNWNYTAGVGNDARGFRYFNIPKQAKDYDRNGDYAKHWLPELAKVPGKKVHEVYRMEASELKRYGVSRGVDYPNPVVDLMTSVKANEAVYNAALSR